MIFLIVGTSFVTFALEPSDGGTRLGLNITLLLTAVSFKNVVCGYLLKTSYFTTVDYYVIFSFVVLMFVILENTVVMVLGPPNDTLIETICMSITISVWCAFNLFLTVLLLMPHANWVRQSWSSVEISQTGSSMANTHVEAIHVPSDS
eukprot:TRINITY_DN2677_c0_g4_i1.p1 TRINITY_DN2677_c0_g4~~TRINITY_DN2677_c0_g4_i1.p1  ORF type:complete len:148 (-),score=33.22 TRINITY_DN2677_c0_g4_i1:9-452(-)